MATIKYFEELEIWQLAREFCKEIFRITCNVQFTKDLRMREQIRSSSGSIMDNIAEGFDRNGNKEFVQFLYIAKGSCAESQSQLFRASDCGYISENEFTVLLEKAKHISQKITKLINYLKESDIKGLKYKKTL